MSEKRARPKAVRINALYFARLAGGASLAILIFSFLINVLMLTGPLFMLQVYDRVLASGSVPTLIGLAALAALLYLLFGFLDFIRSRIMTLIAHKADSELRSTAFEAVSANKLAGNNEVNTLPISDLNTVRQFLSGSAPFAFLDVPWTPIYLFAIYLLHPVLGLAAAGAAVLLVLIAVANNIFTREAMQKAGGLSAHATSAGEEFRQNAEVTAALGMLPTIRDRWSIVHDDALDEYASASRKSGVFSSLSKALRMIFQSGILGLGAYLAIKQEITPGAMIAGSIIMARALAPVDQLIMNWQGYLAYRQARNRLYQAFQSVPGRDSTFSLPKPKGDLKVRGLTVRVPERVEPVLSNVGFDIQSGDGLGIIGPTGSGKTTLARIVVGLIDRYYGNVELDGAEIKQYPLDDFGQYIGYMPQEVHLYRGTIAENIARMRPNASSTDVVSAAQKANVHEMIKSMPQGYETMIKEGGSNLSAGQRQRIGLARALFGDPVLIVLDEPNANLDHEGEASIVAALQKAREAGSTVVVIAHRPSAVAALNKILVLKDGNQVAFGPKAKVLEEVLARKPIPKAAGPSPVSANSTNKPQEWRAQVNAPKAQSPDDEEQTPTKEQRNQS